MHQFARAIITNTTDWVALTIDLFPHNSRGQPSNIKVLAGLVLFSGAFLFGLQVAILAVYSHGLPYVCVCLYPNLVLYRTCRIGLGPTHITSFYLKHLFKGPISKYTHIFWSQGSGFQQKNFEGTQCSTNRDYC